MKARKPREILLPKDVRAEHSYLYLAGLIDGRIKIGVTQRPWSRMRDHHKAYGLAWVHFFRRFARVRAYSIEHAVKTRLRADGRIVDRGEVIANASRQELIHAVRQAAGTH